MQHSHDLAFAGGRSNFTLTHEHEDGRKPHMHDVTPDGSEATNTTWLNPHSQQRWVRLTIVSNRPDNWPSDEDLEGGINGAFPKEWFDPESEDDGFWLESIVVAAPRVLVTYGTDNDAEVSADDGVDVEAFDHYMLETTTDYEPEDYDRLIERLAEFPEAWLGDLLSDIRKHRDEVAEERA